MKRNIRFLIVLIAIILLTASCGSGLKESGSMAEDVKVTSGLMNSQKEVSIKEKQIIQIDLLAKKENVDTSEEEPIDEEKPANEKEHLTTSNEDVVEKEEKSTSKKEEPTYTAEQISGDFMSTIALNMRKGPSTDFQLVGNLQPYVKAVASEKATLNGSTWYKITSNDTTGWSAASYLVAYEKVESPTKQSEKATPKKKTETPADQQEKTPAKQETKPTPSKPKEAPKEPTPKETPTNTSATPSAIEKEVIDLTNGEREKAGLAALKVDNKLVASARAKSNDMSTNNYFDHTSPTYGSAGNQLSQFGVSYRGWGENIAKGQRDAAQVVGQWMNSAGHKANILHPDMTHIGVGFDANGNYWTQQFIYK